MTIENLKEFFKQIGYTWTGTIFDAAWHVVPFDSADRTFAPKTFEEILQYESECMPVPYFIFERKDERGKQQMFDRAFRIIPERFEEYLYYDDGTDFELSRGKNYTEAWLKFQNELNNSVNQ